MNPKIKKSLFDIQTSIESIYDYLGSETDFDAFSQNKLLRRGIEREIEIIGEATNRILKEDSKFVITNARDIVDTRNWIIHVYDKVDEVVLWGILKNHLPSLLKEVKEYLQQK